MEGQDGRYEQREMGLEGKRKKGSVFRDIDQSEASIRLVYVHGGRIHCSKPCTY